MPVAIHQNARGLFESGNSSTIAMDSPMDLRKKALAQLLSSSDILHVALWVDGRYTPEEEFVNGDWAEGRELFFKIEGKRGQDNR